MTLRRYRATHGVGLLHRLPGLEGTYAVALTAPRAYLQQFWDATRGRDAPALPGVRYSWSMTVGARVRSDPATRPLQRRLRILAWMWRAVTRSAGRVCARQ